jgi:hypothetical protein
MSTAGEQSKQKYRRRLKWNQDDVRLQETANGDLQRNRAAARRRRTRAIADPGRDPRACAIAISGSVAIPRHDDAAPIRDAAQPQRIA